MRMFGKRKSMHKQSCWDTEKPVIRAKDNETCSDEACAVSTSTTDTAKCPVSGTTGLKVDLITLKALLNSAALRRLDGKQYRFCPSADCDVVYFDNETSTIFQKNDLTVKVGQKETADPIPICYCFDFTVENIRRDLATHGRTEIPAFIAEEVKAGHCACEVKNPQGSCCLGNVAKAVKRLQAELVEAHP